MTSKEAIYNHLNNIEKEKPVFIPEIGHWEFSYNKSACGATGYTSRPCYPEDVDCPNCIVAMKAKWKELGKSDEYITKLLTKTPCSFKSENWFAHIGPAEFGSIVSYNKDGKYNTTIGTNDDDKSYKILQSLTEAIQYIENQYPEEIRKFINWET